MHDDMPPLLIDLFQAYYDARRHKRNTQSALRFELNFERNLFALYDDIVARTYTISPSTCFIVNEPVQREIFAGDFRDRVVHHLIYNYISPLCERVFIHDSYACRTGRGTSFGIRRADHFIRSVSQNYTEDCYVLKLDIAGYFMSINRALLYEKVDALISRYAARVSLDVALVRWLLRTVIFHDHIAGCVMRGTVSDWRGLPASKSLFHAQPGCGLPIGNLTSQLFGNVYLNDFDHMAMHLAPRVRYGRYVDDMFFVGRRDAVLASLVPRIRAYLHDELALLLHPNKR